MSLSATWRFGKRDDLQHAVKSSGTYGRALCGAWHPYTGWTTAAAECVFPKCERCQQLFQVRPASGFSHRLAGSGCHAPRFPGRTV